MYPYTIAVGKVTFPGSILNKIPWCGSGFPDPVTQTPDISSTLLVWNVWQIKVRMDYNKPPLMTQILNFASLLGHPLGFLWMLSLVGVAIAIRKKQRLWLVFCLGYSLIFWLMGGRIVSRWALGNLEKPWVGMADRAMLESLPARDGIILLGGGITPSQAGPFGMDFNNASDRLFVALEMARQNKGFHLLVSGFDRDKFKARESYLRGMDTLVDIFQIDGARLVHMSPCWNTHDEALAARAWMDSLEPRPQSFYLVTSASHMQRSLQVFRAVGLDVEPMPCDFRILGSDAEVVKYPWFFPRREYLEDLDSAVHEYLGRLVYKLRGWI